MIEVRSPRRRALALTWCQRWELADGSRPWSMPSKAFLRELRRMDPGLELFWLSGRERWALYRVKHRAACPSDDELVKEFELVGPGGEYREPGWWLFDLLREYDKTCGGSIDPRVADHFYKQTLKRQLREDQERQEKKHAELSRGVAEEMYDFALGRHSVHVNRQKEMPNRR